MNRRGMPLDEAAKKVLSEENYKAYKDHSVNLRAARLLGWTPTKDGFKPTLEHAETLNMCFTYDMGEQVGIEECPFDDLEFTTSYDWAMLGVQKLTLEQFTEYEFILAKDIFNIDSLRVMNSQQAQELSYKMNRATPEQITQAWVEILEPAPKEQE